GYHPEYFTSVRPARPIVASYVAPTISAMEPSRVTAGASAIRVVLEGSGFATTSLVRVNGISVKTTFRNPKRLEFDLPASAVAKALPDPFSPPGPAQDIGIIGYRPVAIHVFNPPPDGGTSNTVYELIVPK